MTTNKFKKMLALAALDFFSQENFAQSSGAFLFPQFQIQSLTFTTLPSLEPARFTLLQDRFEKPEMILTKFGNMYNGMILEDSADSAAPFKMWFFGWASEDCNRNVKENKGCDAIFFARSKNLKQWEVYSGTDFLGRDRYDKTQNSRLWRPVLHAANKIYDQWHLGDPSVIRVKDGFIMAYSTTGFDRDGLPSDRPGDTDKDFTAIGGAWSKDGVRWTKMDRPLLVHPKEVGAYDMIANEHFHRPSLMYDGDQFRMWYDYWALDGGLSMGQAILKGPMTVEHFRTAQWTVIQGDEFPAIRNWPNPSVVKIDGRYFSYADPVGYGEGWPGRKVAEAVSVDGMNWKINGYLEPPKECSASQVPEATVLKNKIVFTSACQKSQGTDANYDYRYKAMYLWTRKSAQP